MDELIKSNTKISSNFQCFFAPAKINLFLKILSKRADGYHCLQSAFQLIDLYDEIYFKKRKDNKITTQYNVESIKKENDLCLKAAELILKGFNVGVELGQLLIAIIVWPCLLIISRILPRYIVHIKWAILIPCIFIASIWFGERTIQLISSI